MKSNLNPLEIREIVSHRIEKLYTDSDFVLSVDYLKYIHTILFNDIYPFAGVIRKTNLLKKESVLNNQMINYANWQDILAYLEYDLQVEKDYNYQSHNLDQNTLHIAKFNANIWQAHPFFEGNTRTIAVFIIKYLKSKGFDITNNLLRDNFAYYRDCLVLANYYANGSLKPWISYLQEFYQAILQKEDKIYPKLELKLK